MYEKKPARAKSDVIKRLVRGVSEAALSFGKRIKPHLLAAMSRMAMARNLDAVPNGEATVNQPTPMQVIKAKREALEAELEACARLGYIGDGITLSLLASYQDELAERRRLLTELEHRMKTGLRRLAALCPAPPAPEPAPLPQPRPRKFTRAGAWLSNGAAKLAS
jgi:hypothetical protein